MILRFIQWLVGSWCNHQWETIKSVNMCKGYAPNKVVGQRLTLRCKKCGDINVRKVGYWI